MTEEFLHFVWKFRMLSPELTTSDGVPLQILHPGEHNSNSGPDFFNARVRIGDTLWAGNVEIHVHASDWVRHRHSGDKAYDNIILHVVLNEDALIRRENGDTIPTLVLQGRFPAEIFTRYRAMMENRLWIPCFNMVKNGAVRTFRLWSPALAVERLKERSEWIRELWISAGRDWEETLYRLVARGFGFKINSIPFDLLGRSLPLKIIRRHRGQQIQVESLLFGQARMLDAKFEEDYPRRLKMEYEFLRSKYDLVPVNPGIWKFMRLRPSNFPTIRISQFGRLIVKHGNLLEEATSLTRPEELVDMFNIQAESYWDTHFTFDKLSPQKTKNMGITSARVLAANTLAPFLFFLGTENDRRELRERAVSILEEIPCEINSEVKLWEQAGMMPENALDSQALLQLKSAWCDRKRCIECRIGKHLLSYQDHEVEAVCD